MFYALVVFLRSEHKSKRNIFKHGIPVKNNAIGRGLGAITPITASPYTGHTRTHTLII